MKRAEEAYEKKKAESNAKEVALPWRRLSVKPFNLAEIHNYLRAFSILLLANKNLMKKDVSIKSDGWSESYKNPLIQFHGYPHLRHRFASIIVMLKRLKLIKTGLQAMVISEEWSSYRDDDTAKANFVKEKIVNDECLLTPREQTHVWHFGYEMWDSMIEKVKFEIYKKEKRPTSQRSLFYDVVKDILVARWTKNNTPLHYNYSDSGYSGFYKNAPHRMQKFPRKDKIFEGCFP
ncbi:hypothetical protein Tco_0742862 [Tanacetum coccineum]